MIDGLGCAGWGVGGIEAEAVMLGQAISMVLPEVVGFKLTGKLKPTVCATDLVLTCTNILRKLGVVGKFVEFYGEGCANLTLADRATIANMAPEYGIQTGDHTISQQFVCLQKNTSVKMIDASSFSRNVTFYLDFYPNILISFTQVPPWASSRSMSSRSCT